MAIKKQRDKKAFVKMPTKFDAQLCCDGNYNENLQIWTFLSGLNAYTCHAADTVPTSFKLILFTNRQSLSRESEVKRKSINFIDRGPHNLNHLGPVTDDKRRPAVDVS